MRANHTLLHKLRLWAEDQPHSQALYYKDKDDHWKSITVEDYWLQVIRFAQCLVNSGLKPGDRVVIFALNSPEWIQWELATWLMGGVTAGIHPSTAGSEIKKMIEQTAPKLILVESELFKEKVVQELEDKFNIWTMREGLETVMSLPAQSVALLNSFATQLLSRFLPNQNSYEMIIFTSGTTGTPKGVRVGMDQLSFVSESISNEWQLPFMEGHLFSFLPLAHIAEKIQSVGVAISQRYPIWFNSGFERFAPELKEVRPTLLLAVPRIWEKFKEEIERQKPKLLQRLLDLGKVGLIAEKWYLSQVKEAMGLDRLQLAVSGAAKLPPSVGEWFKSIQIEIQEIYGMSETCGLITLTKAGRTEFETVGGAPTRIEVRIAPNGEVLVRGPHIFRGYDHDEEGTKAVMIDGEWLKTGDLGEWKSGKLHLVGRDREIIKLSNGRMVAPLPIENALRDIDEVLDACVVGEGKPGLLAILTLKEQVLMSVKFVPGAVEGILVEDQALKAKISTQLKRLREEKRVPEFLTRFIVLSRAFAVDRQELTPTHKLNRAKIHSQFQYFIDQQFE